MAKKTTRTHSESTSNYPIIKTCAFWGLVVAGVAGIVSFILWLLQKLDVTIGWGSKVVGVLNLISHIAIFITVWLAAWGYVRNKNKTWKILYVVFLVLSILGLFGIGFF